MGKGVKVSLGNTEAKRLKKEVAESFRNLMQSGVLLYLEDRFCEPDELSNLVCESTGYMADYVIDETGKLSEVRFDKVCES